MCFKLDPGDAWSQDEGSSPEGKTVAKVASRTRSSLTDPADKPFYKPSLIVVFCRRIVSGQDPERLTSSIM